MSDVWKSATTSEPCRICGKGDWCAHATDGDAIRCMRETVPPSGFRLVKRNDDGGSVFAPEHNGHNGKPPAAPAPENWTTTHSACVSALTPERLQSLTTQLGVTTEALKAVGVGWHAKTSCFTWPERDEVGAIIGIGTRGTDGRKLFLKGGKRGLTIVRGFDELPDPVLIVEGPSDCAALLTLGLTPIGRPSNKGGVKRLAKRCRNREILIVGENDQKPDGEWPGKDGAITSAQGLANTLGKPVSYALPPDDAKDSRSWLNAKNLDLSDHEACEAAGRELLAGLRANAVEVQPEAEAATPTIDISDIRHGLGDPVAAAKRDKPFACTDMGNARRFAWFCRDRLIYVPLICKYFTWDGRRWRETTADAVVRDFVKPTINAIWKEVAALAEIESVLNRGNLAKHAVASQSASRISAMLTLGRSEPGILIENEKLDADPFLLNCLNGTVDLRTGELREHRQSDLITKCCNAAYRPGTPRPIFDAFLSRIFRKYPTLPAYILRVFGYAATGDVREQCLFFLYGTGANGKTVLIDAVVLVLGDYADKADPELLIATDKSTHPTNVADLRGKRFAVCSETNDSVRINESKTKDLTGETKLKARHMNKDFFTFTATHKIFLYSNHRPVVRGTDRGFWRRIRLIPFVEQFRPAEENPPADELADKTLPAKLATEADGILTAVIEGAGAWYRDGLGSPEPVREAVADYRQTMDLLGAFIDETCVVEQGKEVGATDLYKAYVKWCDDNGERPLNQTRFGTQLTDRGHASGNDPGTRRKTRLGLRFRTDADNVVSAKQPHSDVEKQGSETVRNSSQSISGMQAQNGLVKGSDRENCPDCFATVSGREEYYP